MPGRRRTGIAPSFSATAYTSRSGKQDSEMGIPFHSLARPKGMQRCPALARFFGRNPAALKSSVLFTKRRSCSGRGWRLASPSEYSHADQSEHDEGGNDGEDRFFALGDGKEHERRRLKRS